MKRPAKTIITITVALILASSLAYAAEKKKQAKLTVHKPETTTPEETLEVELLADIVEHQEKLPLVDAAGPKKIEEVRSDASKGG